MQKRRWSGFLLLPLMALGGCGTGVSSSPSGPGQYAVNVSGQNGMYVEFAGLQPSTEMVPKEAANLCPNGYDETSQPGSFYKGMYVQSKIRCR